MSSKTQKLEYCDKCIEGCWNDLTKMAECLSRAISQRDRQTTETIVDHCKAVLVLQNAYIMTRGAVHGVDSVD